MTKKKNSYYIIFVLFTFLSCSVSNEKEESTHFSLIDNEHSNIQFSNEVKEDLYFNFLNYSYIYNGAGVAVGDINNDGLQDIYFSSNQESNKLYLNEGNLEFNDITEEALVQDVEGWTTGVSMIDINNDGWLDIYVCKSGSLTSHELRKNKLFVNQRDNTFKEEAEKYGLDHFGFSTQAYFFDYDSDGDLDMYLVNHRQDFENNINVDQRIQIIKEPYNSDQLFRNDGNTFTNVTKEAGVENKAWGLSASIGDFNNDNLPDIYVANDFLEPDFLYINQGDGTFKDEILKHFNHISANSMGSDFADINNDLKPDLIVLDMLAEDHIRSKKNMATMSTENFNTLVNIGYHHQYMSNVLQLNNGDGTYSEIGQLSGIAKTDWSWAPLIADFDNDGLNDLFVTNGIENDLSNQDFRNQMRQNIQNRKKVTLDEAIDMMPSTKLKNYMFKNASDFNFENKNKEWGFDIEVNSNGCAYADLDNDGDLDLILNNQGQEAQIYKNNSVDNYLVVDLKGSDNNKLGIGTKVNLYADGINQYKELYVSRGYQSSVQTNLHFGLGEIQVVDSIEVVWPNGKSQIIESVRANETIELDIADAIQSNSSTLESDQYFEDIEPEILGVNFEQLENNFDDFSLQLLLPQKQSEVSSPLAVGDVNGDGLDDFYVGNSLNALASLYIQKNDGTFVSTNNQLFQAEKKFEDTDAEFIDIDKDDDLDLVVTSGGYEVNSQESLQDRVYVNDGNGNFARAAVSDQFQNTKGIASSDIDNDGYPEVFIGNRVEHGKYPLSNQSSIFKNNNGSFQDITAQIIDDPLAMTMVNDALFSDFDKDGDNDLIVVGEWMPIIIYENIEGRFVRNEMEILTDTNGWYQTINEGDFNNDGYPDFVIGNWGYNNKFHPSKEKPLHIYADYFDENESFDLALSKVSKTGDLIPVRGKECSSQQTPFINDKLKTFEAFATSTMPEIYGVDKLSNATHFIAHSFSSVVLLSNGNKGFIIKELPIQAQFGPTLSFEVHDINNDGHLDILGVGNVYEAEVETIRYDASKGYVLLGNGKGDFTFLNDLSYFNSSQAKTVKKINISGQTHFLILNKNAALKILKLRTSGDR